MLHSIYLRELLQIRTDDIFQAHKVLAVACEKPEGGEKLDATALKNEPCAVPYAKPRASELVAQETEFLDCIDLLRVAHQAAQLEMLQVAVGAPSRDSGQAPDRILVAVIDNACPSLHPLGTHIYVRGPPAHLCGAT